MDELRLCSQGGDSMKPNQEGVSVDRVMPGSPMAADTLKQAVASVLQTFASEAKALNHLFNLAREIARRAKEKAADLEEYVKISESVKRIIGNITKVQMMTQVKMGEFEDLFQGMDHPVQDDLPEK
jgi:coenzyme F420-reducing hydrogenase gamma subunit